MSWWKVRKGQIPESQAFTIENIALEHGGGQAGC